MKIKLVLSPEAKARLDTMTDAERRQFLAAALAELKTKGGNALLGVTIQNA